jgi:regulator of protease activity HflC (stomatin/prohibitin superfamily)
MNKVLLIIAVVLFLGSCKSYIPPANYIILVEGSVGKDLSRNKPVMVIDHRHNTLPTDTSKCLPFVLPPMSQIPVFVLLNKTSSESVIEQLITHIEKLRDYIEERDRVLQTKYSSFLISCK